MNEWNNGSIGNNMGINKVYGDSMSLTFHGYRYDLDMNTGILRYRNVISPRDGGMHFPDGYFTEKTVGINREGMLAIENLIHELIPSLYVEKRTDYPLPPGASPDASMRINYRGVDLRFCNLRPIQNGSMVESVPIPDAFVRLAKELGQYCDFPKYEVKPMVTPYPERVPDRLNVRDVVRHSERVIGYKHSLTGVSEYEFYAEDKKQICAVYTHALPYSLVSIKVGDTWWESKFEECTIGPGTTRYVMNTHTGKTVAKLVYRESGMQEINDSITVFYNKNTCSFFAGEHQIALVEKTINQRTFIPGKPEEEYEPFYDAYIIRGSIDRDLLALILAFPIL